MKWKGLNQNKMANETYNINDNIESENTTNNKDGLVNPANKTQWNILGIHSERLKNILFELDNVAVKVKKRDASCRYYIRDYFALIKHLFENFVYPLTIKTNIPIYDKEIQMVYKKIKIWEQLEKKYQQKFKPIIIINMLERLNNTLLEHNQRVGLGILVRTSTVSKRELKNKLIKM